MTFSLPCVLRPYPYRHLFFHPPFAGRRYYSIIGHVKRQHYQDPQPLKEEPIIITNSQVTQTADKWSMDYLTQQMGRVPLTVMSSEDYNFLYYNDKRNKAKYPYNPKAVRVNIPFNEFREGLRTSNVTNKKYYMQHYLGGLKQLDLTTVLTDSDGQIISGFMIWIGKPGSVTPTHYDQQHVFLSQVKGYKKITLFPPEQFSNMYAYPTHHSYDRQSQVNFDEPDDNKFPLFSKGKAIEAIIGPGEVLFIPAYWWHYVESVRVKEKEGEGGSENYSRKEKMESEWANKIQLIRTIERIAGERMGEPQANQFFKDFSQGVITSKDVAEWPKVTSFWEEIKKLSKGIVEEEKLGEFLKVMLKGRFENVAQLNTQSL